MYWPFLAGMFLTFDTPSTSDHEKETLDTSQIKVSCACYDDQFL